MTTGLDLELDHRPSALAYHAQAFHSTRGLKDGQRFPPLRVRWRGHRLARAELERFNRLAGLPSGAGPTVLHPQVFAFRLQMVVVTHRAFPLPIWGALQVRNHLLLHAPIPVDADLDLETGVAEQRILEKGAEVDLHTELRHEGRLLWEGLSTFYYRGRHGPAEAPTPRARQPEIGGGEAASWVTGTYGGWLAAGLTGDYNGIHYWSWYARRFGFRRAFHHPQIVLGQILARLPAPPADGPCRLDAWLKGPVYYGSRVHLQASAAPDTAFALRSDADERPAILGRLRPVPVGSRLLEPEEPQRCAA